MVDTCPASGRPGRRGPSIAQPSLPRSFPPSAWRRSRSSRRARSPEVLFFIGATAVYSPPMPSAYTINVERIAAAMTVMIPVRCSP